MSTFHYYTVGFHFSHVCWRNLHTKKGSNNYLEVLMSNVALVCGLYMNFKMLSTDDSFIFFCFSKFRIQLQLWLQGQLLLKMIQAVMVQRLLLSLLGSLWNSQSVTSTKVCYLIMIMLSDQWFLLDGFVIVLFQILLFGILWACVKFQIYCS